jgi:hypothetical protein
MENRIVEELNRTFAIVHTSSTYILIEKSETEFVLDSKASLLMLYENQPVIELTAKNSKKAPTKAQIWLQSSYRRTFDNIVFDPREKGHYGKNYNIWKGFAAEPKEGDCSLYWEHLKYIICSGKESHYSYMRKWLAHLIQYPWLIGTSIVLRGKQGVGKGTLVDPIGTLFGSHYAPLASLDKILGRFNSHLKNAFLIYAQMRSKAVGQRMSCIAQLSTRRCSNWQSGYSLEISVTTSLQRRLQASTFALSTEVTFFLRCLAA